MKQGKRFLSLFKLQNKYTVKPLVAILALMFFVEGGFILYHYKTTDFSVHNETGFDALGNVVSYKAQTIFYQFGEVITCCPINVIFLSGGLLGLTVFVIANLRRKSIIMKKVTYQQVLVSKRTCLNVLLIHTVTMMTIFLMAQFLMLKFWHRVYASILPSHVVMEQYTLNQLFSYQGEIAIAMNLSGLIFLAAAVIYVPLIRKSRNRKILYSTLGIGSYLLLSRVSFVIYPILQTAIFLLLSRLMYVEVYRKLHTRKDIGDNYAGQVLNLTPVHIAS